MREGEQVAGGARSVPLERQQRFFVKGIGFHYEDEADATKCKGRCNPLRCYSFV